MRRYLSLLATFSLAFSGAASGAPIVIDTFSSIQSDTSSLDDPSVLGGERDVVANGSATFESGGGQAVLATPSANFVLLGYDGDDDSAGVPSLLLGPVDLTSGGMNDLFVFDVAAVTGVVDLSIRVTTGTGTDYNQAATTISTIGLFKFAFSDLTVSAGNGGDPASVDRLGFRFNLDDDESITLNQISTDSSVVNSRVPAPGSLALLGLGLAALGCKRLKS